MIVSPAGSIARSADDLSSARIDVDPDDRSVAHELETLGRSSRIEFRTEIVCAGHARHDAAFDIAQSHCLPLAQSGQRTVLILVTSTLSVCRAGKQTGGRYGGKGGFQHRHGLVA